MSSSLRIFHMPRNSRKMTTVSASILSREETSLKNIFSSLEPRYNKTSPMRKKNFTLTPVPRTLDTPTSPADSVGSYLMTFHQYTICKQSKKSFKKRTKSLPMKSQLRSSNNTTYCSRVLTGRTFKKLTRLLKELVPRTSVIQKMDHSQASD